MVWGQDKAGGWRKQRRAGREVAWGVGLGSGNGREQGKGKAGMDKGLDMESRFMETGRR